MDSIWSQGMFRLLEKHGHQFHISIKSNIIDEKSWERRTNENNREISIHPMTLMIVSDEID